MSNKSTQFKQPFHIVSESSWPLGISLSVMIMVLGLVMKFNGVIGSNIGMWLGMVLVALTFGLWWNDVTKEASYIGEHTEEVKNGIKIGIGLFYISECCLFASLFWAYLHARLSPNIELGSNWPPLGINGVDEGGIPLLNLIILLSSGAVLTWGHEKLLGGSLKEGRIALLLTVLIGIIFVGFQFIEYSVSGYTLSDGIYGSGFYLITSFHMLHVILGATFILVSAIRVKEYTKEHQVGVEAAVIYWHLVDVIYLFVYLVVYYGGV